MIYRLRTLAVLIAAAVLLPVAAQAGWYSPCGCRQAPVYPSYYAHYYYGHYYHRYWRYWAARRRATELTQYVYAVPYGLRRYPYVNGYGSYQLVRPTYFDHERRVVVQAEPRGGRDMLAGARRVIDADAQITILGPDRMNIRLFRKSRGRVLIPAD